MQHVGWAMRLRCGAVQSKSSANFIPCLLELASLAWPWAAAVTEPLTLLLLCLDLQCGRMHLRSWRRLQGPRKDGTWSSLTPRRE